MAETVEHARILGIAKQMDKELTELPMEAHGTVVEILRLLAQHRLAGMQRQQVEAQQQAELTRRFGVPGVVRPA